MRFAQQPLRSSVSSCSKTSSVIVEAVECMAEEQNTTLSGDGSVLGGCSDSGQWPARAAHFQSLMYRWQQCDLASVQARTRRTSTHLLSECRSVLVA